MGQEQLEKEVCDMKLIYFNTYIQNTIIGILIYFSQLINAPVKLFWPHPPGSLGVRKYACNKNGRGSQKRVILVII